MLKEKRITLNKLQYLNLSYNNLGVLLEKIVEKKFGLICDQLEYLYLVKSHIDDKSVTSLIKCLPRTTNLYELDLSHNPL